MLEEHSHFDKNFSPVHHQPLPRNESTRTMGMSSLRPMVDFTPGFFKPTPSGGKVSTQLFTNLSHVHVCGFCECLKENHVLTT